MEEKRVDDSPLIGNVSGMEMMEMTGYEKKPTRTSSMTNKRENEHKEDKEDPQANDVQIDISDHMNDPCNPQPIFHERNQQRPEEPCPAAPIPEEASFSPRQVKSRVAVAIAFLTSAGAAIFSGLHNRIGNESSHFIHKGLFKACSYSLYAMFIASGCLLILSLKGRRYKKVIDQLINLSICGAFGSASFATAFALCLLLDLNSVGSVLVLVFATFPLGLVVFVVYSNGDDSAG